MLRQKRRSPRARRHMRNGFSLSPGLLVTGASLCLFLILGGGPIEANVASLIMLFGGACCLIVAGSLGGLRALTKLPPLEVLCIIAIVAVPLLQLVPLPPSVWKDLPGRATENELRQLAGMSSHWLPISLDRAGTIGTLAFILAFGGLFLGGLNLREREIRYLSLLIIGCAVLSFAIGAIQLSTSGQLTFHPTSHRGTLLGFFANRNHQGLFLAVSILMSAWAIGSSDLARRTGLLLFGFYTLIALAAAFGTASRTGLALCLIAAGISPVMFLGVRIKRKAAALVAAILTTALIVFANMNQVAGGVLGRYGEVSADYRWTMWQRSMALLGDYFPVGTGIGAYADVYAKFERKEWLIPQYVNAAHNDYIQFFIEAGILGVLLILLIGAVLLRSAHLNFKKAQPAEERGRDLARLGLFVIALVLIHSVVDYPLRRPAIGALFALSLALIMRPRIVAHLRSDETVRQSSRHPVDS